MPFDIFFLLYYSLNFGYSFIILEDSTNKYTHYYVTSSKIGNSREELYRKFQNGSVNFKISLEPYVVFELWIKERIPNVIDGRTEFQYLSEKEIATLKNTQLRQKIDILVEGFVSLENYSSSIVGYILNSHFYGTVDIPESTFSVEAIQKYPELFHKYKNTSYNAVVYRTNRNPEEDYFRRNTVTSLKVKRHTVSDGDSYKNLKGKG